MAAAAAKAGTTSRRRAAGKPPINQQYQDVQNAPVTHGSLVITNTFDTSSKVKTIKAQKGSNAVLAEEDLAHTAFTACAIMVVPSERLATGIGGSATFRQIGLALGAAALVALFGTLALTEVLDAFDRSFLFMVACGAASSLTLFVLAMLMRGRRPPAAEAIAAPAVGDRT
ncbi:MAG: hypothetical protein M3340_01125 [Actinomycetota bacterium]|nr:hypothetical protein [Actinomycetota bacterium]